jgi:hypothetical protein
VNTQSVNVNRIDKQFGLAYSTATRLTFSALPDVGAAIRGKLGLLWLTDPRQLGSGLSPRGRCLEDSDGDHQRNPYWPRRRPRRPTLAANNILIWAVTG